KEQSGWRYWVMISGITGRKRGTVKLSDVAKLAGVSKGAASVVLSKSSKTNIKVAPETVERIKKAATELSYVPNFTARSLSSRRTGFVAYLLSETIPGGFENTYFMQYMAGVEAVCRELGYGFYAASCQLSKLEKVIVPEQLSQRAVDGVVMVGSVSKEVLSELKRLDLPAVFLNVDSSPEISFPTFCDSYKNYDMEAVAHAVSLNHKRIMFCTSCWNEQSYKEKCNVLREAVINKYGGEMKISFSQAVLSSLDEEIAGINIFHEWQAFAPEERPTLLYGNPMPVLYFLREFNKYGYKCPEDLSVILNWDPDFAPACVPAFTAVRHDLSKIGRDAAEALINHLAKGTSLTARDSRNTYPCKIIQRESSIQYRH
ncbi:MAG: LacI family DNA-binding transcriptional regulator, partial [Victivallales bacterium]|nr:LacI family DNA-binding transcriptional regulator [Victivallales bacterium]